jgi:hypothetical protein
MVRRSAIPFVLCAALASALDYAFATQHGVVAAGVFLGAATVLTPLCAGPRITSLALDLLLLPALAAGALALTGLSLASAVRCGLVFAAWNLVLRGLAGLARLIKCGALTPCIASSAGAVLLLMPLVLPQLGSGSGALIAPLDWLLGFGMGLDWARLPGFYESFGDKYLGEMNGYAPWLWLGTALVCDRLGWAVGAERVPATFGQRG